MHIGNLRTALYAYLYARSKGGDFLLRIEDTDQERKVGGAIEAIYRTLETAGIRPDEGPNNPGAVGPYVQSERKDIYKEYAERLINSGGAYYCFCDMERLLSLADANGVRKYDKHCLSLSGEEVKSRLAAGEPHVVRQNIPLSGRTSYTDLVFGEIVVDCADLEDNILLKSDGMPTYNFANVVDDHLMGITHIIRGVEYLSSTPKYNLIYKSFGWDPPEYMHLPLIMKDATRKLSKRYGDANFEDFIEKGYLAEAITNYVALLGWSPKNNLEKLSMKELIGSFSPEGLTKSNSVFDETKMKWLNGLYIKELSPEKFFELSKPFYDGSPVAAKYDYKKFAPLLRTRIETFGEIPEKVAFIDDFKSYDVNLYLNQKLKVDLGLARSALELALGALENFGDFENIEAFNKLLSEKAAANGLKSGQILSSVRLALTGCASTPGGAAEMAGILGREESLRRLRFSLSLFKA
jgi:glutamyl-tRNA synthetase, bacterial family